MKMVLTNEVRLCILVCTKRAGYEHIFHTWYKVKRKAQRTKTTCYTSNWYQGYIPGVSSVELFVSLRRKSSKIAVFCIFDTSVA